MTRLLLPLLLAACAGSPADSDSDPPCASAWFDGDSDGYGAGPAEALCHDTPGFVRRDGDCDDLDPTVHPGAEELCDGVDGDCDGLADSEDGCQEGACDDELDGDFDGLVDCDDPDCDGQCAERCEDGRDNDGDGQLDCADSDCFVHDACVEMDCEDGLDNEGDGLADCRDPDCWGGDCGSYAMGVTAGTLFWTVLDGEPAFDAYDVRGSLLRGATVCAFSVGHLSSDYLGLRRQDVTVEPGCGVSDGRFLPRSLSLVDGQVLAPEGVWLAGWAHDDYVTEDGDRSGVVDPLQIQAPLGDCFESSPSWAWNDGDEDGFGDPEQPLLGCAPSGVLNALDCDDANPEISPDAVEVCADGVDNNCDGDRGHCAGLSGVLSVGQAEVSLWGSGGGDKARRVRGVGDLDGDGLADLVVGVPHHDGSGLDAGALVLVYGADLVSGPLEAHTVVLGVAEGDFAAGSVAAVGDINGDGVADLVVGATGVDAVDGADRGGAAYLLYGPIQSGSLADAGARILAPEGLWLGSAVEGAGDLDGDGTPWVAVGAQTHDGGGPSSGAVLLFRAPLVGDLSPSDADAVWVGGSSDIVGDAVAALGDVNGDGKADLLVGHRKEDWGAPDAGAVRLLTDASVGGDLQDAEASWFGEVEDQWAGRVVAAAGDANGDGYADALVGAQDTADSYPVPWAPRGEAYLLLGSSAPVGGDLRDAHAVFVGERVWDEAGMALSGGHDVNGDGLDDLLIGAQGDDAVAWYSGAAYLVLGGVAGVVDLDGAEAKLVGLDLGDMAGSHVAMVGDVNGDGFADVAVGARAYDGGVEAGRVDVLFGGAGW